MRARYPSCAEWSHRRSPGACSGSWASRLLLFTLSLLLLASCAELEADGAFVRVQIEALPARAATITVETVLDGVLADQTATAPLNGRAVFSVGLRLKQKTQGSLISSAAVFDDSGCLLATGQGEVAITVESTVLQVGVKLVELSPTEQASLSCPLRSPVVLSVSPSLMDTAARDPLGERQPLVLRGWGFRADTAVTISGNPQSSVRLRSARELVIDAPRLWQRPGPAHIVVSGSDGTTVQRDDLLTISLAATATPIYSRLPPTGGLAAAVMVDADGDGALDALTIDAAGHRLRVYRNLGAAGFALLNETDDVSALSFSQAVLHASDLDRDGRDDLLLHFGPGYALSNRGGGHFELMTSRLFADASGAGFADLDGDTRPDLVIQPPSAPLEALRNLGDFRFTPTLQIPLGSWSDTAPLSLADVDRDGRLDALISTGGLLYHRGRGLGFAPEPVDLRLSVGCSASATSTSQGPLALGDLDGDGQLDIAPPQGGAVVLSRAGTPELRFIRGLAPCFSARRVFIADFNRDGTQDVIFAQDTYLSVVPNLGGGNLDATLATNLPLPSEVSGSNLAAQPPLSRDALRATDLDGNGAIDLVLGTLLVYNQTR